MCILSTLFGYLSCSINNKFYRNLVVILGLVIFYSLGGRHIDTCYNKYLSVSVTADACVACYQEHVEQARCVHRVLVPRVHLRQESVVAEQSAGRTWCHQTPTPNAL